MFKTLIAVDGSPVAQEAVRVATGLLAGKSAEVTVLSVIPRHYIYGVLGPVAAEHDRTDREHTSAEELVRRCARELRAAGIGPVVTTELAEGDPAEMILLAAEDADADLIILGSRGLNATRRFLLGSVSTKVATHATCGVLVVHPKKKAVTAEETQEAQERREAHEVQAVGALARTPA